ncbi:hypothetical protein [Neochlamydia sp. S13]|nr:hypothetical protein [Neochlamydia sp. S13]
MRKYKELAGHKTRTTIFIGKIVKENPELFVHWNKGMIGAFA